MREGGCARLGQPIHPFLLVTVSAIHIASPISSSLGFFFILSNQFPLPLSWTYLSLVETFFRSRCSVRNFGSPIILYHILFYKSSYSSLGRIIYSPTFIISKIFYGVKCPVAKMSPLLNYIIYYFISQIANFLLFVEKFSQGTQFVWCCSCVDSSERAKRRCFHQKNGHMARKITFFLS